MNIFKSLRFASAPLAVLGLFACDLTDSEQASGRESRTTTIAPRVVMAHGGAPKASQFVRLQVKVQGTDIVRDTVYPYAMRRGRVQGIPVGAQVEIAVAGFDSVVNDAGQPELVYRWAGAKSTVAQAVTPDMDSATVAATQPVVEAVVPANVSVSLASVPTSLPTAGDLVTLPTALELGLGSDKEYRYAIDVGDESKIVSVSAGSPLVPADGKVDVAATSWVKVRVFSRESGTGLMLGTDGDSILVHVPPPVPVVTGLNAGNAVATVTWTPLELGRVQILFRQVGDTGWQSVQAGGDVGSATLTGLVNGTGLDVKLRTIWGPKGATDLSAESDVRSVVPVASVPTALGAGTWYGSSKDPDTITIGWFSRSLWVLSADGKFRLEQRGYLANWSTRTWTRYAAETEGTYSQLSGQWAMDGDSLRLTRVLCASVTDTSVEAIVDSESVQCRDGGGTFSYGVQALGGGVFALTNPEGWMDTIGLAPRPDPVWPYVEDAVKPTAFRLTMIGDTIRGEPSEVVWMGFTAYDDGSGLDSVWIPGRDFMPYSLWRPKFMDWLGFEDTIPASGVKTVSVFLRDGAGNVQQKDFYFATNVIPQVPDWTRAAPTADTVWVKSGTITLSGKIGAQFDQVYLDTTLVTPDAEGNVNHAITPSLVLSRKILKGVYGGALNSYRFLDTLWVGLDATAPGVGWVSPVNGSDTTLAAGTTSRVVNVTVTDAGSGVASVKIGTLDLSRSGNSWTGTVNGLVPGINTLTLVATDALGNITNRTLTLKVKTDIPLAYDTLNLGSEKSTLGSFLSVSTSAVYTTSQAAQFDSSTFKQNWTQVDVVFRSDSANGQATQGHLYSPASTLTGVTSPNVSSFVKVSATQPLGQASLAIAHQGGSPVAHLAVAPGDRVVVKTAEGKYALLSIGAVNYSAAYTGTCTIVLGR